MAYVNAAHAGHVTIFSTGGKFHPVSNCRTFLCALAQGHESEVLPKLTEFYTLRVAPEIVCRQRPIGLSIRDLHRAV